MHQDGIRARRVRTITSLFVACIAFTTANKSPAAIRYDFIESVSGNDNVLAVLEFATLPADHTDVVSLTFTEAGNDIFGLGTANITLTDSSGKVVTDNNNGLEGDIIPNRFAYLYAVEPTTRLTLSFDPPLNADNIIYEPHLGALITNRWGDWTRHEIPEPTTLIIWLSLTATAAVGYVRWRRRNT